MSRACDSCGSLYEPLRKTSRYCSGRCRKRAQRSGLAKPAAPLVEPESPKQGADAPGTVTVALLEELRVAGREKSALGQAALVVARRLDSAYTETGAAVAALNKDFRAAREAALKNSGNAVDALDEMARKREERMRRAGGS